MIKTTDNFLPRDVFKGLQSYCNDNKWQLVTAGDKQFSILPTPEEILPYLQIEGHEIILTFIRRAYNGFDQEMRAHCDGETMGKKTSLASVLYLNEIDEVSKNGTMFYNHHIHGESLDDNSPIEEFDRLIIEDSNDESKWEESNRVYSQPNRMLNYSARLFHGKFPNKIEFGIRKVLIVFYCEATAL